jgi:hypothetical protein
LHQRTPLAVDSRKEIFLLAAVRFGRFVVLGITSDYGSGPGTPSVSQIPPAVEWQIKDLTTMRLISSKSTWVNKKAFPAFWFGFLGLIALVAIPGAFRESVAAAAFVLLVLSFLTALGYMLMHEFIVPLVDEVWIDGDDLVVRNRGEEDHFPISHVVDVDDHFLTRPEYIELLVNPRTRFGLAIRFMPADRWWPFRRHPLAQELIDRSKCFERRGIKPPQ